MPAGLQQPPRRAAAANYVFTKIPLFYKQLLLFFICCGSREICFHVLLESYLPVHDGFSSHAVVLSFNEAIQESFLWNDNTAEKSEPPYRVLRRVGSVGLAPAATAASKTDGPPVCPLPSWRCWLLSGLAGAPIARGFTRWRDTKMKGENWQTCNKREVRKEWIEWAAQFATNWFG